MSNTRSKSLLIGEENLACSMGSGSLRVLATPAVVALMENAAASLPFLSERNSLSKRNIELRDTLRYTAENEFSTVRIDTTTG